MKKKIAILTALVLMLIFILLFESCDLFGVSKEERIDMFLDDLNQNPRPDSIRFNFSSSCTVYGTITGAYFSGDFPLDSITYNIYSLDVKAEPITGMIAGSDGGFSGPYTIEFTMTKEGCDWYILVLELDVSTIVW